MAKSVIGVEIGGTKLQAALGTSTGEIVRSVRGNASAHLGAKAILEWFLESIPPLLKEAETRGRAVKSIGVGFGGPVETTTGKALVSHQVGGWSGFPLKEWFEERFSLPTSVANDANAAGWAEYCLGTGRGTRNFVYNNIGSGIGGALIVDGRLHDGQGIGAGEIGHTYVPDWSANVPGASIKLEDLCSGWSIERRMRAIPRLEPGSPLHELVGGDPGAITCPLLAQAAGQGDKVALEEIDRVAGSVGLALANVITLFHPERIALGGGVSLMGDVLLVPLRASVERYVFGPYRGRYDIHPCALAESAVIAGALLLAP